MTKHIPPELVLTLALEYQKKYPNMGMDYRTLSATQIVEKERMDKKKPKLSTLTHKSAVRYALRGYAGGFLKTDIEPFDGMLPDDEYKTLAKKHKGSASGHANDYQTMLKGCESSGKIPWFEHGYTQSGRMIQSDTVAAYIMGNIPELRIPQGANIHLIAEILNRTRFGGHACRNGKGVSNAIRRQRNRLGPLEIFVDKLRIDMQSHLSETVEAPSWYEEGKMSSGRIVASDAEQASILERMPEFEKNYGLIAKVLDNVNYLGLGVRTEKETQLVIDRF